MPISDGDRLWLILGLSWPNLGCRKALLLCLRCVVRLGGSFWILYCGCLVGSEEGTLYVLVRGCWLGLSFLFVWNRVRSCCGPRRLAVRSLLTVDSFVC